MWAEDDHYDGFLINQHWRAFGHWSPRSAHGGSKYQLVALVPACRQNLTPLQCIEQEATPRFLLLRYPFRNVVHLPSSVSALISGCVVFFFIWPGVTIFFTYKTQQKGRWDYPAIVGCCCKPPKEKQDLHGWINSRGSQTALWNIYPPKR